MKSKLGIIGRFHIVFGICSSLFLAGRGDAGPQIIANEYRISPSTYTADLGTLSDPLYGSTQAKFDGIMGSRPVHSTIHILPGTYQTRGHLGYSISDGQKIIGSGRDVTILQLVPGITALVMSTCCNSTNVEVSDLTLDCNYTSGSYTRNGIVLNGSHNAVRRVKVINGAQFDTFEFFGIILDVAPGVTIGQGNLIEDCEVSHMAGPGGTAIDIHHTSGTIRNNKVFMAGPL